MFSLPLSDFDSHEWEPTPIELSPNAILVAEGNLLPPGAGSGSRNSMVTSWAFVMHRNSVPAIVIVLRSKTQSACARIVLAEGLAGCSWLR